LRKLGRQEPPNRYEVLVENRQKRKLAMAQAQGASDKTRSIMVNHINNVAKGQVQLSETMLRSKVNKQA
jgi:hypothetical protein